MLDFVVISLLLNRKTKEKQKTQELIERKREIYKESTKTHCEYCGQYLPWFCVCYLNKKKD
jgi:dolichyl-phosphate-mannose--protein O-mannosyl transferase